MAGKVDTVEIAKGCGYPNAVSVNSFEQLDTALEQTKNCGCLRLIEVKCFIGARADLGRPTTAAKENKKTLFNTLASNNFKISAIMQ